MKGTITILALIISTVSYSQIQNFIEEDINGNMHDLFEYLDAGKTVIVDIGTTACGPCWDFHQTNELESFYQNYGPNGTNNLMVFMWEASELSTDNDVTNTQPLSGFGTAGDWTIDISYPLINSIDPWYFTNSIHILGTGYPVIYVICPDRSFNRIYVDEFVTDSLVYRIEQCLGGTLRVDPNIIDYSTMPFTCYNLMGQIIKFNQIQVKTMFIKRYENGHTVKEIKS